MSKDLEEALGLQTGALSFLDQLNDNELSRLQAQLEGAREVQRKQVDQAIESGLQIIPRILRKTVRRILGDS